ncbi:uncharacterized protein LOC133888377 [Phragmites australis]|uniref:uncharacterized protein LOC133888377 n=1 Tax=Phragmites australis TaxID=29695 RepID=UPI002D775735|nr:uncharacterized protein LOC133888377 [Phragmites australis]
MRCGRAADATWWAARDLSVWRRWRSGAYAACRSELERASGSLCGEWTGSGGCRAPPGLQRWNLKWRMRYVGINSEHLLMKCSWMESRRVNFALSLSFSEKVSFCLKVLCHCISFVPMHYTESFSAKMPIAVWNS